MLALEETYASHSGELRRVTAGMCPDIYHVLESDRVRLQEHMPWTTRVRNVGDLEKLMVAERAGGTRFDYALYTQDLGFSGCLSVIDLVWAHRQCRLQYWLRPEAEGLGLLGDALKIFERAVFAGGIHRIEILCQEVNPRSVRFAERNGYIKEGVQRHGVFHLGEFRNVVMLAKLSPE